MLDGKVAIVTGAGQGIGRGIALALAEQKARLVIVGRTLSKCEDTVKLILDRGGQAIAVACNVNELADLARVVETTRSTYGRIDILVNNAQEFHLSALLELTDDEYEATMRSGPGATFRMMRLCYPDLKITRGSIINLGSTGPMVGGSMYAPMGAYNAAKEAIRALTRAAAVEWGPDGIRTNAILPIAQSPTLDSAEEEQPGMLAATAALIPLRRLGDCEKDIGRFVATLCSDACSYVNGQSIAVDGGLTRIG